jgi:hypothetical protein
MDALQSFEVLVSTNRHGVINNKKKYLTAHIRLSILYPQLNVVKSRKIRRAGHVTRAEQKMHP